MVKFSFFFYIFFLNNCFGNNNNNFNCFVINDIVQQCVFTIE